MPPADAPRSEQPESRPHGEGIDTVAIYQAVLRALVYLEQKDYTETRQADVHQHGDLPDPASARDSSQG